MLGGAAWKPLSAAGGGGVSVALWKAELQVSDDLMDVLKKKKKVNQILTLRFRSRQRRPALARWCNCGSWQLRRPRVIHQQEPIRRATAFC